MVVNDRQTLSFLSSPTHLSSSCNEPILILFSDFPDLYCFLLFVSQDRHHEKKSKHRKRQSSRDDYEKVNNEFSFPSITQLTKFYSSQSVALSNMTMMTTKADVTEIAKTRKVINESRMIGV